MNQCEQLLDYMKSHGSITGYESIVNLGVLNCKGRIHDLRKLASTQVAYGKYYESREVRYDIHLRDNEGNVWKL